MGVEHLPHAGITDQIIRSAIYVHKSLGPGLLELAYQRCLAFDLRKHGFNVRESVPVTLTFDELEVPGAYRLDLVVENCVLVELKSVEKLSPIHTAQAITYLKFSGLNAGLILNFNELVLRDGLRRVFNNKKTP
jgi:GxxExxY protein